MSILTIDQTATWRDVASVAEGQALALSPAAWGRVDNASRIVERIVESGVRAYGVNTGVGALSDTVIIIPQVLRLAIPGMGNVWQLSLKDSALISVTGLSELMRTSQVAAGSTRQYFLFFIVGGALYLILTSISDRVFNRAERSANRSMPAAMGQA